MGRYFFLDRVTGTEGLSTLLTPRTSESFFLAGRAGFTGGCSLHGPTGPCDQKGPEFGCVLCCRCLEMLRGFCTRGTAFHLAVHPSRHPQILQPAGLAYHSVIRGIRYARACTHTCTRTHFSNLSGKPPLWIGLFS